MDQAPKNLFTILNLISQERGISFFLIGGNAINTYGYIRTTFDIDIAVPDDQAATWSSELVAIGYVLYFCTDAFQRFEDKSSFRRFPVDLMLMSPETFKKIHQTSVLKKIGTVDLLVPSPLHLIAMKLHALKQPRRAAEGKDLNDMINLIRFAQINVQSSDFQAIIDRYADASTKKELFNRLKSHE